MIKELQKKFIFITMISLFFVTIVLVGLINAVNLYSTNQKLEATISSISNQKQPPDKNSMPEGKKMNAPQISKEERYFLVLFNADGSMKQIDTSFISEITSKKAQTMAKAVLNKGQTSGFYGSYKFKITKQSDSQVIVFLYCQNEIYMAKQIFVISLLASFAILAFMFAIISILSKRAIRPIIENNEKQKQFITDAGHEIKTPLAIISANADVLELMHGESEWIKSIRNQTMRLDKLLRNLLILAKAEELNEKQEFVETDFSILTRNIVADFTTLADSLQKKMEQSIEDDILIYGAKEALEQLVSTLVDNALKYSNDCGNIKVSLSVSKNKKNIQLEVYNTIDTLNVSELDKLFERFYRSDASRSRESGGYGIGLSIAKSIVAMHHGKIIAKSEDEKSIRFIATFPVLHQKNMRNKS